jgi:hypothetical protein
MALYRNAGVGILVQRDAESRDLAGFAKPETYDQSTNMLGLQKY